MIGVLGGMGPMATADFLRKLVEATPAKRDRDHIPVIVQSLPQVPDRTAAIVGNGPSPLPDLVTMAKTLKTAGADFGVIACNTAHHWYDDLVMATDLEILHIVDAVCAELKKRNADADAIGLMATPGTIGSGFYQTRMRHAGFSCHLPDKQALGRIFAGIETVKANDMAAGYEILSREVEVFQRRNIKTIILGCTELPLVLKNADCFVDTSLALANACVARSIQEYEPSVFEAA